MQKGNSASPTSRFATYFVDGAVFQLIGRFDEPEDCLSSFVSSLINSQKRYPPMVQAEPIYRLMDEVLARIENIAAGNLLAFEYFFPHHRGEVVAILGITRLPNTIDAETLSACAVEIRDGKIHEQRYRPTAESIQCRRKLFTKLATREANHAI